jgi:hypothetical protein
MTTLATTPGANLVGTITTALGTGGYSANSAVKAPAVIGGTVPSLQAAALNEILLLVSSSEITADTVIFLLTQSAFAVSATTGGNATASAGLLAALGTDIGTLVADGVITAADAVTRIGTTVGGFLGSNPSTPAEGIALLVNVAAADAIHVSGGPAGLEAAAQSEISQIIGANEISAASAVTVLQNQQTAVSPGSVVFAVITNEITILTADAATLDATVATGNAAQISAQAASVAALFGSDPTDFNLILSHLSGRIASNNVTVGNALTFLFDLMAIPVAFNAAASTLVGLATPAGGQPVGVVPVLTALTQINTLLNAGSLGSASALTLFEGLLPLSQASVQSSIAGGIITGHLTVAQIAAAVAANPQQLAPADAIAALADAAFNASNATRADVLAEVNTLATAFPSSADAALPGVLPLTLASDASTRAAGYASLNALVVAATPANLALVAQVVTSVINTVVSFPFSPDLVADAKNELFGTNALVTQSTATFNAALSAIAALPGSSQVPLLVQMLGLPGEEPAMFTIIEQKLRASPPPFTPDQVIAAIAQAYGADSARTVTTSIEFTNLIFDFLLQQPGVSADAAAHEFVLDVSIVPVAMPAQMLLQLNPGAQNGDARYIALVNAISARISLILANQSIPDYATSLGALYSTGAFTPAQVVQATVNFYTSGSPQNFLTLIAALPAGAFGGENAAANVIAGGIVNAVTAGTIGASLGIELLLVIGTQSTAALQSAAITFLAAAVANGSAIATNAGVSISLAVSDHATVAASVATMLAQLVFSQPTIASTVSFYIAGLVNGGQIGVSSAATAMAAGAHGATAAQQYAIGGEIAGLGFFGSDPSTGGLVANAVLAASGPTASELLNVIAGFVGQASSSLQLGVGEALAALVTNGTLTVTQVGGAFDTSYISGGVTTPAQLNTVIVGLLAGGSVAAAANLAFGVGFSQEPVSDIAAALSAAVTANTITALQVVDLAANIGLQDPAIQTLISPLLSAGAITGQAAVQELGSFI